MPDANDWNQRTITEFRAKGGRVGGTFEGPPLVLVHQQGRKSGLEYVTPTMYLPDDADNGTIYVFATKAGHCPTLTGTTTSPPSARATSNAAPRHTP
jgi:hypothetical protein